MALVGIVAQKKKEFHGNSDVPAAPTSEAPRPMLSA